MNAVFSDQRSICKAGSRLLNGGTRTSSANPKTAAHRPCGASLRIGLCALSAALSTCERSTRVYPQHRSLTKASSVACDFGVSGLVPRLGLEIHERGTLDD